MANCSPSALGRLRGCTAILGGLLIECWQEKRGQHRTHLFDASGGNMFEEFGGAIHATGRDGHCSVARKIPSSAARQTFAILTGGHRGEHDARCVEPVPPGCRRARALREFFLIFCRLHAGAKFETPHSDPEQLSTFLARSSLRAVSFVILTKRRRRLAEPHATRS